MKFRIIFCTICIIGLISFYIFGVKPSIDSQKEIQDHHGYKYKGEIELTQDEYDTLVNLLDSRDSSLKTDKDLEIIGWHDNVANVKYNFYYAGEIDYLEHSRNLGFTFGISPTFTPIILMIGVAILIFMMFQPIKKDDVKANEQ